MYLTTIHTKDFNKVLRYIIKYRLRYEDYFHTQLVYFGKSLLQYVEQCYPNEHDVSFVVYDKPSFLSIDDIVTMKRVTFDLVFEKVLPDNIIIFRNELFYIDLTDSILDSDNTVFVTNKENYNLFEL